MFRISDLKTNGSIFFIFIYNKKNITEGNKSVHFICTTPSSSNLSRAIDVDSKFDEQKKSIDVQH